jgi:hypothetical protein
MLRTVFYASSLKRRGDSRTIVLNCSNAGSRFLGQDYRIYRILQKMIFVDQRSRECAKRAFSNSRGNRHDDGPIQSCNSCLQKRSSLVGVLIKVSTDAVWRLLAVAEGLYCNPSRSCYSLNLPAIDGKRIEANPWLKINRHPQAPKVLGYQVAYRKSIRGLDIEGRFLNF